MLPGAMLRPIENYPVGDQANSSTLLVPALAYDGLTIARTGTAIVVQRGGGSPHTIGNNAPLWEDYGDGAGGGVWSFETYSDPTLGGGGQLPAFSGGSGATAACVQSLNAGAVASLISGGDLDVELEINHGWTSMQSVPYLSYTLFSATTPDGLIRLRFEWTAQEFILTVRGVDVLTARVDLTGQAQAWLTGDYFRVRFWYRVSMNQCGIQTSCNGAYSPRQLATTTGSPLAAATAAWWGSNSGTSGHADARHTLHTIHPIADLPAQPQYEFLAVGDSITAPYQLRRSRDSQLYSFTQRRARPGILVQAVPGDGASGQRSKLLAGEWASLTSIKAVMIMVGINDVVGGAPESTLATIYQSLVNTCRSTYPGAKIYAALMTPAYKNIDDYCAAHGLDQSVMQAVFTGLNADIRGTGAHPITGIDRVVVGHYAALGSGPGGNFLALAYDQNPTSGPGGTQEGLHPNEAGELVIRNAFVNEALIPDGLL